jgi:hypothetical protein
MIKNEWVKYSTQETKKRKTVWVTRMKKEINKINESINEKNREKSRYSANLKLILWK